MDILQQIINHKKLEVNERKSLYPLKLMEKSIFFDTKPVSLKKYIKKKQKSGIIAEFKRKSPSRGYINENADVVETTIGYMQAGASGLSILTDNKFFGGTFDDLRKARLYNYCPILQKDFIIDEYQIFEAKSNGADAILLIAAALTKKQVKHLVRVAKDLAMEVLFEVHNTQDLKKIDYDVDVIGVNNRKLKSFTTSLKHSEEMFALLPKDYIKISESGINNPEQLIKLKQIGYDGFLIGSIFMQNHRPSELCKIFSDEIIKYKNKSRKNENKSLRTNV